MQNIVRWGLLSTAKINGAVIRAINNSTRGVLQAVASRKLSTARSYARKWKIEYAYGSYEEMLASNHIDAVYIGLPNHLHASWTIRALEAGKHVLCEKPFALSVEEVDAVADAVQRTGKTAAEAFMYRHHPQTKILGDWVHGGKLGDILYVWGVFNFKMQGTTNVRLKPEWGGGSLWDIGVYPMSLAQFVYGAPPVRVTATQRVGQFGVDDLFMAQMQFAGGGMAQLSCSFDSPYHTQAQIIGTNGHIEIARPFNAVESGKDGMIHFDKDGKATVISVPDEYLYQGEVEDMHDVILEGAQQFVTLAETRNHIRTAQAMYHSAETNQPVDL